MTSLERIRIKLEAIDEDPTSKMIVGILYDLLDLLEEREKIGFKK